MPTNPSVSQKRFHEATLMLGCVVSNEQFALQLHHVKGREYKHNKIHIGHWFVLPLRIDLHDVKYSEVELNVTHHKNAFEKRFGSQAKLWLRRLAMIEKNMDELPLTESDLPPQEVRAAIADLERGYL